MDVRAYLREELAVDVGLFVALGVGHAALVDLPQEHLGKALVQHVQGLSQAVRNRQARGGGEELLRLGGRRGSGAQGEAVTPPLRFEAVRVLRDVAVVDVGGNVGKEFFADVEGRPVEDDEINRHVMVEQEVPDSVHCRLEGLVLGIAVGAGGDEREGHGAAAVLQRQPEGGAICGAEQLPLSKAASPPDRADGVDDVLCGQAPAPRYAGLPRRAAA